MQLFQNLVLVGTSHVARQSVTEVESVILREKPSVVALELDKARFIGLMKKEKSKINLGAIRTFGFKGYVFAKVGEFAERKLGSVVGVSPGEEMLKAADVGSKLGCKIALVDQKIEITLKNFSKEITWKEKFRFIFDIFSGMFSKKKRIQFDLSKVPNEELVEKLLEHVKIRYPNFYKVLVEDRNKYMARKLFILMKEYDKIVAVVGAGHEKEIIEGIKKLIRAN